MVISIFFLIGVFLLNFVSIDAMALQPGSGFHVLYQIITHMFAHANAAHLMGNYMFVFPYAIYLENRIGKLSFVKAWFACGLAAAGLQVLFGLVSGMLGGMIGSSGAAFGIVAAALFMQDSAPIIKYASRILLSYHILTQVTYAYMTFTNPMFAAFVRVAFAAHLGGILMGCLVGYQLLKKEKHNGKPNHPRSTCTNKAIRRAKTKSLPRRYR